MAAIHNAFTITVLALDIFGVIRPAELNTIIPNKNEKRETIDDYANNLGVKASFHQALATHQNTPSATVANACSSAASVSTSLQDPTQVSNLSYSNIDFALSTVPVTPSIVDEMRFSLAKAGHNSIGLSHRLKSADRTSSTAILPRPSGGLGLPDPLPVCLAANGFHRHFNTDHEITKHAAQLTIGRTLTTRGTIRDQLTTDQRDAIKNS